MSGTVATSRFLKETLLNMFIFSGFTLFLRADTILPEELKKPFEGQLVAKIDKYFQAILVNNRQ